MSLSAQEYAPANILVFPLRGERDDLEIETTAFELFGNVVDRAAAPN